MLWASTTGATSSPSAGGSAGSGSITARVPGRLAHAARRRPARGRRSRRAARRRGGRRGCRSRRPARPRAAAAPARRSATSTPKPSSPRKMLPMPATSTRGVTARRLGVGERLDLVGVEVQVAALPGAELGGRVVVDGDGHVVVAVDVVEHARHRGGSARRGTGRGRRPGARGAAARALPWPTSTPPTVSVSVPGSTPASAAGSHHGSRPSPGRRARRRPARATGWRRARRSPDLGRHVVAAVDDGRGRGSVPRASAFSSSVRVSTRRARISSISVAS